MNNSTTIIKLAWWCFWVGIFLLVISLILITFGLCALAGDGGSGMVPKWCTPSTIDIITQVTGAFYWVGLLVVICGGGYLCFKSAIKNKILYTFVLSFLCLMSALAVVSL
jgi:hypothetical protein